MIVKPCYLCSNLTTLKTPSGILICTSCAYQHNISLDTTDEKKKDEEKESDPDEDPYPYKLDWSADR